MVSLWENWYVRGSFNTKTRNSGEDDIENQTVEDDTESDKGTRGIVLKQGKTSLGGTCYVSWLGRQERTKRMWYPKTKSLYKFGEYTCTLF